CAVAEAAQELRKRQKSEGGRADQSGMDSRKEGERVAEAEDAMEVDGTGPSGVPKAAVPKDKVPTAPKRRDVEHHEGRKVVREHGGVQSKLRGPRRSLTVDEEVMKVVKKEEFDALIRLRIETLDEAMRRRMEKGKGKATDLAASGAGKATDEITVRKMVAPKKRATAKSKAIVGSETNEAGEGGRPVAGPSKPSSDEGEEFPEPSDDDEESESGKRRNPRRQAKPRKGSMALPKVEIVERNMRGTTRLPSLGPTNGEFEPGCRQCTKADVPCQRLARNPVGLCRRCRQKKVRCERVRELDDPNSLISQMRRQRDEVIPVPAEWHAFMQETNRRMDDMARQIGELGREVNKRLESNSNKLDSVDRGLKLVLDMLSRNGLADAEGSVEQRSEPAYRAAGSTDKRTL
ncbi:hypothetical protein BDN71DRAFT_1564665, partial [Pleurotus eryngii]